MSNLPKTYRAAQFEKKGGDLKIIQRDLQLPKAGSNEILVKTVASGICHSDSIVQYDLFGGGSEVVPGHEIVGDVVAVPEGYSGNFQVGQRVASGWHGGQCQKCSECIRGRFQCCLNGSINGIVRDGGYAEYVLLRSEACISLPEGLDPVTAAPLLCAGVTVFNSLRSVQNTSPGDLVAVQGLGGLGHLGVMFANQMGFRVAALTSSESKKELAEKLGADYVITGSPEEQAKKLQELGGAKVIQVTAPNPKLISPLLQGLGVDGTLLIVGVQSEPIPLDTMAMIQKRLSVKGWPSGHAADSEDCCKFAALKGVKTMTETYSLDEADKGYKDMMAGKPRFRAVIKF